MSTSQSILDELEAIGAVGTKVPPPAPEPQVSEVTLEAGGPAILRDERGLKMLQYCERAVELLDQSIAAQQELRDVFIELHDLWVEDDAEEGPGDEDEDEESEDEESEDEEEFEEDAESIVAAPVPLVSQEPAPVEPPAPAQRVVKESNNALVDAMDHLDDESQEVGGLSHLVPEEALTPPSAPRAFPPAQLPKRVDLQSLPPGRRAFLAELKKDSEKKKKIP